MVVVLALWRVLALSSKVAISLEASPDPVSIFMTLLASVLIAFS